MNLTHKVQTSKTNKTFKEFRPWRLMAIINSEVYTPRTEVDDTGLPCVVYLKTPHTAPGR